MVEMALALPILLLLLLGAVDYARVLSAEQRLENAVHVATLRLLTTPSLVTSTGSLTNTIQGESGLSPVSATASYTVSGEHMSGGLADCCNQVAVTASYSYTLLLPGLQNLRIGPLSNGTFRITTSAAGIATTSPPIINDTGGSLIVTPPSDLTTPPGLTLKCTLYKNGVMYQTDTCSSSSPFTISKPAGTNAYKATLTQINGLTSAQSATVSG
jgi:Flp pilus assembly protein TadG